MAKRKKKSLATHLRTKRKKKEGKMIDDERRVHELKIKPEYFEAVIWLRKRFELRKFDRDFRVGDTLKLREYKDGEYTGRNLQTSIKYILSDCPEYGLMPGYCILGI